MTDDKAIKSDSNKGSTLTFFDLISVFIKNRKMILVFTFMSCLISIILYFFVFDLIYYSSATIKSTSKSSGLLGALDAGLPDIGGLDDLGIGGGKSAKELASYQEILMSRRCLEELIRKFGLMERDEYDYMEDAIKDFRENKLKLTQEKTSDVLFVGVFDKDPALAKEMVEFLLQTLNKINIEMSVTNAKNNRLFIEKRYTQAKYDLSLVEDSLKQFQMIYGIAPDLQIKASAQSVFTLEAELKAEEIKLDVIKKILSSDQPEVKMQEAKVSSLREKISGIQNSTDLNDYLRLGNSPIIAMSYLRLQRDLEIQTKILTFMIPVFEQAKIEEQRETPTVIVMDTPYIAEKKTKPKRLTMVIIFTFMGFGASLIGFLVLDKIKDLSLKFKVSRP